MKWKRVRNVQYVSCSTCRRGSVLTATALLLVHVQDLLRFSLAVRQIC